MVDRAPPRIAVESLAVEPGTGQGDLVVLEEGVLAHPRPDARAVLALLVTPFRRVLADVVFDQRRLGVLHDDPVAAHVVDEVVTDDDPFVQSGIDHGRVDQGVPLFRPVLPRADRDAAPVAILHDAPVDEHIDEARVHILARDAQEDPAGLLAEFMVGLALGFVQAVDVMHKDIPDVDVAAFAHVGDFDPEAAPVIGLRPVVGDLQVADFPMLLVEEMDHAAGLSLRAIESALIRCSAAVEDGAFAITKAVDDNRLARRARAVRAQLAGEDASGLEENPVAGLADDGVDSPEGAPCLSGGGALVGVVAVVSVQVVVRGMENAAGRDPDDSPDDWFAHGGMVASPVCGVKDRPLSSERMVLRCSGSVA